VRKEEVKKECDAGGLISTAQSGRDAVGSKAGRSVLIQR